MKGHNMDNTNGGWDAACERMALDANTAAVAARDGDAATALALAVGGAWAECSGICNVTGFDIANPPRGEERPADYAERAWNDAARRMLEHMDKLRELAERVVDTGTTPPDWDAACQRMAAQARTAADANWRALALELAEAAHTLATTTGLLVGMAWPDKPTERVRSAFEVATNLSHRTLAVVERVRRADA